MLLCDVCQLVWALPMEVLECTAFVQGDEELPARLITDNLAGFADSPLPLTTAVIRANAYDMPEEDINRLERAAIEAKLISGRNWHQLELPSAYHRSLLDTVVWDISPGREALDSSVIGMRIQFSCAISGPCMLAISKDFEGDFCISLLSDPTGAWYQLASMGTYPRMATDCSSFGADRIYAHMSLADQIDRGNLYSALGRLLTDIGGR